MSEIEKMYELAGIKPYDKYNVNKLYPPFIAEKQIKLVKLLGSVRDYTVEIDKFKGVYYVGCREAGSNDKHWGSSNIFEDAIAELINGLWKDLTEEERKQIKEILE